VDLTGRFELEGMKVHVSILSSYGPAHVGTVALPLFQTLSSVLELPFAEIWHIYTPDAMDNFQRLWRYTSSHFVGCDNMLQRLT
jgi:hypothetical protein